MIGRPDVRTGRGCPLLDLSRYDCRLTPIKHDCIVVEMAPQHT